MDWCITRQCTNVRLNGIEEGKTLARVEVALGVMVGTLGQVKHKFLTLEDGQMPYYVLIGIEFLRKYGLSVNVRNERLMNGEKVIARMHAGDICFAGFVGVGEKQLLTMWKKCRNARMMPYD